MKQNKPFYGWLITLACFTSLIIVFGTRLSFQVFFVALTAEFGWNRAGTAGIFALSMVVFALTAPFFGKLLDKWGPQKLFSIGTLLFAGGLVASSGATQQWHLYFWYGLVASVGITILGLGNYATLISHWFKQKRGLAIGIAFAGTGGGTFLIIPLTERFIATWGWQMALIAQAILLTLTVLPLSFFILRLRPAQMGLYPDGEEPVHLTPPRFPAQRPTPQAPPLPGWTLKKARMTPTFWLILASGWGALFALRFLTVHQIAIAVDAGIDRFAAATAMGFSGAVIIIAFVMWGAISDRFGRRRTFIFSSLSLILAFVVLLFIQQPHHLPLLYLYALLLGLGEGSRSSLVTAVINDTFPGPEMGQITGYAGMAFGAGSAVGSWSGGALFDLMGNYTLALWLGIAVTIFSAGCMGAAGLLGQAVDTKPKIPPQTKHTTHKS